MRVEVIIPWRAGCPWRERALEHVLERWEEACVPVAVSSPPAGPWVKAAAVLPAAERSDADVLVVADADVWCDGVQAAVEQVAAGSAWAVPHGRVHRLTEAASETVLAGGEPDLAAVGERPYAGHPGGGIVVLPRSTLLDVPPDPRFVGWGQEDDAWAAALLVLAGAPWRGEAPLWHLWHPPQPRLNRRVGSRPGHELMRRYVRARRSAVAMRDLVEEGRAAWLASASS